MDTQHTRAPDSSSSQWLAQSIEVRRLDGDAGKLDAEFWARRDMEDFMKISAAQHREQAAMLIAANATANDHYNQAMRNSEGGALVLAQARVIESSNAAALQAQEGRAQAKFNAASLQAVAAAQDRGIQGEKPSPEANANQPNSAISRQTNAIESDEVFTASSTRGKDTIPPELDVDYIRDGTRYRYSHQPGAVAFEDRGNKLETETNSEAVASSMVKLALARGWDEIKVSGSETFRREVWFEAAERGMTVKGYRPNDADKARLDLVMGQGAAANFRARETAPQTDATKRDAQVEALRRNPDIAPPAIAEAAIAAQVNSTNLTPAQKSAVLERVHDNIHKAAEKHKVHSVTPVAAAPGPKKRENEAENEHESDPDR